MSLWLIFLSLVPIVAFVLVDMYTGAKNGILVAMFMGIVVFLLNIWITKSLDASTFLEPLLIITLGIISLKFTNPKIFKFQPMVVNIGMALILIYYQVFSTPFLVKYLPAFVSMLPANEIPKEMLDYFTSDNFKNFLSVLSHHLIYFFLCQAALVAYTALRCNNFIWFLSRLVVYPTIFVFYLVEFFIFAKG